MYSSLNLDYNRIQPAVHVSCHTQHSQTTRSTSCEKNLRNMFTTSLQLIHNYYSIFCVSYFGNPKIVGICTSKMELRLMVSTLFHSKCNNFLWYLEPNRYALSCTRRIFNLSKHNLNTLGLSF